MDLMTRRRALMVSKAETPTEYITDGLVLWLDGINKGSTTNAWTDLVNGVVFSGQNGITYGNDYVQLHSANSEYFSASLADLPLATDGTIEVVCDFDISKHNGIIFTAGNRNGISFGFYFANEEQIIWTRSGDVQTQSIVVDTGIGTVSISELNQMVNGRTAEQYKAQSWDSSGNISYIGKRNSRYPFYFDGKIYSIRIYNRQLTRAEALANYAVDRQRFSLFQN